MFIAIICSMCHPTSSLSLFTPSIVFSPTHSSSSNSFLVLVFSCCLGFFLKNCNSLVCVAFIFLFSNIQCSYLNYPSPFLLQFHSSLCWNHSFPGSQILSKFPALHLGGSFLSTFFIVVVMKSLLTFALLFLLVPAL